MADSSCLSCSPPPSVLSTPVGRGTADFGPLIGGTVAALLYRRTVAAAVVAGSLAGVLSFLAAWLPASGRAAFDIFAVEAVESPVVIGTLGAVFAVLVGGIGAYVVTLFYTEAGRQARVRHWRRWWW